MVVLLRAAIIIIIVLLQPNTMHASEEGLMPCQSLPLQLSLKSLVLYMPMEDNSRNGWSQIGLQSTSDQQLLNAGQYIEFRKKLTKFLVNSLSVPPHVNVSRHHAVSQTAQLTI